MGVEAVERGLVPDSWTRLAIRRLCRQRLMESRTRRASRRWTARSSGSRCDQGRSRRFPKRRMSSTTSCQRSFSGPFSDRVANTVAATGRTKPRLLPEAEDAALALTCQHAQLQDGQDVLELGCGWGSLSLWMAERYPNQPHYGCLKFQLAAALHRIAAARRGLSNLCVITADMNDFRPRQH